MKLPILRSLSLLLLAAPVTQAQTAADFFHAGATNFLRTNIDQAKKEVTNGLALYPNDRMLTNLWALLNRQQEQQQQQDKNNDQEKDQNKKDQQSKDQQSKDQQKQDQQKKDQQKQEQEKKQKEQEQAQQKKDQQKDEKKQDESQKDQASKPEDKPEDQTGESGKTAVMRMTPQQAMQLLDAQKNEERTMIFAPQMKTNRQNRAFKDW